MTYLRERAGANEPSNNHHSTVRGGLSSSTDGGDGLVDLRLAESYIPLWLCMVKAAAVVAVHTALQPTRAHVLCVSLLTIDRVGASCCGCISSSCGFAGCRGGERIVDSNAVAWAVLCAFLVLLNTGLEENVEEGSVTTPVYMSFMFGLWTMLSAAHLTNGGIPLLQDGSPPATAFMPGLRHPSEPLPVSEVLACTATAVAVTVMCDAAARNALILPISGSGAGYGAAAQTSYTATVAFAVGIRACAYIALSCAWSYMVVLLSGRRGATGPATARATAVLTATRFMVVFYTPLPVVASFSACTLAWMSWIWFRQVSMHSSSKKDDDKDNMDAAHVLAELYTLEEAAININQFGQAPLPTGVPPTPTRTTPATTHNVPPVPITTTTLVPAPPSAAAAIADAAARQVQDPVLRAFHEAKAMRREEAGMQLP